MKKAFAIIFFLLFSNSFAQEIKLGFRIESFSALYERTDSGKKLTLNHLPILYYVFAIKANDKLQIDFRPGYSIIEDYGGFEFGGYLKYFPSENIYFLAAYNAHFMGGEAHGTHSNNETTFLMPGLGIGIVAGKYSSLEFMLFIPSPKEWKYDAGITSSFDLIIKIGLGFDWSI